MTGKEKSKFTLVHELQNIEFDIKKIRKKYYAWERDQFLLPLLRRKYEIEDDLRDFADIRL